MASIGNKNILNLSTIDYINVIKSKIYKNLNSGQTKVGLGAHNRTAFPNFFFYLCKKKRKHSYTLLCDNNYRSGRLDQLAY